MTGVILKDYQQRALATVQRYLEILADVREKSATILEIDSTYDWARAAWEKGVRENVIPSSAYQPRRTGLGEPLPTICLKIPTGGGKTLLATKVVDLVGTHYHKQQAGLVLWIVPTTQIYNQTLGALKDRDHPYRQQLDLVSAGRTLILEKTSGFGPSDVAENLCVLMLMLPSANRETKETLRMFRDSGGFDRFFPSDEDVAAQGRLLERVPNLDTFGKNGFWGAHVKTSLGNTLRLLKPLIVLDEGHKAYSVNAKKTLEGFNPSMIVELSATPPRGANVLVDIRGRDLHAEEMIKLDLHIRNRASSSWQDTLLASIEHRERLEAEAVEHHARTGVYIRPICVIQVERTGRDQRRPGVVHAEDVRDYLLRHGNIGEEMIAVKTSQRDELKEVDRLGGLLARECPIRFIITKQALQEGWDCAFAYVLTVLTNPNSKSALTQLVGRVLRQPYARKTHVAPLDECYVFCFQRRGTELLQEIRKGFGLEGLHGLEGKIVADDEGSPGVNPTVTLMQREPFRTATRDLVLPAFMIEDDGEWRLVHHESDILSRVPWDVVDVSPLYDLTLGEGRSDFDIQTGLQAEALEPDPEASDAVPVVAGEIDYYFAASHLLDVMPNPWRGSELARRVFGALREKHSHDRVAANYVFVLEELRKHLAAELDRLSQGVFRDLLASGAMRFIVVAEDLKFNRLPVEIEIVQGKQANREDGAQYQRGLFDTIYEDELNGLENKVATYLDQQERLFFWYRNRARKDYYVQGWRPGKIYADFVFTLRADEPDTDDELHRVFVVETKGLHLKGAGDTDYKRRVFDICSGHAARRGWAEFVPAMRDKVLKFEIVDEEEWEKRLNFMLGSSAA